MLAVRMYNLFNIRLFTFALIKVQQQRTYKNDKWYIFEKRDEI